MDRLSLNDDDASVRRWFVAECEKAGAVVKVDSMGNIFGIRKGRREGAPTGVGSHLGESTYHLITPISFPLITDRYLIIHCD